MSSASSIGLDRPQGRERRVDRHVDAAGRRCRSRLNASFWTTAMASRWVRFIFQLPEMSGRRGGRRHALDPFPQGRQAGQVAVLEKLERRPAAGRDVVDPVGQPEARPGRRRCRPPPPRVKPLASATASATVRVPAANRGSSNTPMGPFHRTVRASAMTSANAAAVPGPMSRPIHPSGTSAPTWRTSPLCSACAEAAARG